MKVLMKVLGGIVLVVLVLLIAGLIYLFVALPSVGDAADLTIDATPELIERGKYLANHVTVCIDCHSTRDMNYYSGPIVPGTEGQGGQVIPDPAGTFYPSNITPTALGDWTDGEIARAITAGVRKDGEPLFPMMPYPVYRSLAEEDVEAIVAYLRTLTPIEHEVPRSELNFPLNLIVRTIPKPYEPQPRPSASDTLAYGKYLTTVSGCHFCHTPIDDMGQALPGMDFAGGMEFRFSPERVVRSANITPAENTGIGAWEKAYFIGRFKEYADSTNSHISVAKDGDNTVMPWTMYAGMTLEDLTSISRYIDSVKPISNSVEKYPKPQAVSSR